MHTENAHEDEGGSWNDAPRAQGTPKIDRKPPGKREADTSLIALRGN